MSTIESGDSQVVQQFREFYRRVIELKRAVGIVSGGVLPGDVPLSGVAPGGVPIGAAQVRDAIVSLLENQQRVAARVGGDYILVYDDARYVMTALADEIFLHSQWEGRAAWDTDLVEVRFYGTRIAGDLFFQRVDRLLIATREGMNLELAKIYLLALSLGFEGRYRGNDPEGDLERYRSRLSNYVHGEARMLTPTTPSMFPRAHEYTMAAGERRMLPPLRRWVLRFALVLVLALALQHMVWRLGLTTDVWAILRQIFNQQTT